MLNCGSVTPRASLPGTTFYDVLCVKIRWDILAERDFLNLKNSQVNNSMREVAHAWKQNPLSDLDEILQTGRCPRRNHLCKLWSRSVKGLGVAGGGQVCPSPLTLIVALTTLSHYRASVWCDGVTTVPARHSPSSKRILHLSAGQCQCPAQALGHCPAE